MGAEEAPLLHRIKRPAGSACGPLSCPGGGVCVLTKPLTTDVSGVSLCLTSVWPERDLDGHRPLRSGCR
jgi:hypothetical protein